MEADDRIRHFTLDGQTVLLEDCAELKPKIVDRLRALAFAGRLSVGPTYVLPDELLPGPESLVRNLLHGQHVARRFGFSPRWRWDTRPTHLAIPRTGGLGCTRRGIQIGVRRTAR